MLVAALIFLSLIASPAVQSFRNKYLSEQTDLSVCVCFFFHNFSKFPNVALEQSVST